MGADLSAVEKRIALNAALEKLDVAVAKRPGKQVEIFVAHGNVIRYTFLKAMNFDTRSWLNLGGSNCSMTQLRINNRGEVICDFFADHGSRLPIGLYTYNMSPDV